MPSFESVPSIISRLMADGQSGDQPAYDSSIDVMDWAVRGPQHDREHSCGAWDIRSVSQGTS